MSSSTVSDRKGRVCPPSEDASRARDAVTTPVGVQRPPAAASSPNDLSLIDDLIAELQDARGRLVNSGWDVSVRAQDLLDGRPRPRGLSRHELKDKLRHAEECIAQFQHAGRHIIRRMHTDVKFDDVMLGTESYRRLLQAFATSVGKTLPEMSSIKPAADMWAFLHSKEQEEQGS